MMRDADIAMYQAKRAGKARHAVFDHRIHEVIRETLRLETDLRRAIQRKELDVYYQPIYEIATGRLQGFEALARWNHPTEGWISPTKFIPLAEEVGLIDSLGTQILRLACQQGKILREEFPASASFILSANLSCKQFSSPTLVENIKRILDETGFKPRELKFEITESLFLEHRERALEMLNELCAIGIQIDIDDFGTGYSNLGYLTRLPISTLKIDRSFVHPIGAEGKNVEIVQTIITLARNLGMKVIAEGVETEAQLDQLKKLHCEGAQGFYLARPMPFGEATAFITSRPEQLQSAMILPDSDIATISVLQ
jgi:EAL domain-containing protein (putative c-di-GMP-specific phosphodiesterase class I)